MASHHNAKKLFYETRQYLLGLSVIALLLQLIPVLGLLVFFQLKAPEQSPKQVEILMTPQPEEEPLIANDNSFFDLQEEAPDPTPEEAIIPQETPEQEESSNTAWDSPVESLEHFALGDSFDKQDGTQNSPIIGDSAIAKRLKKFGGRSSKLDIRVTLLWNNKADLDLKVQNPVDETIFFGAKEDSYGGLLDIDKNVVHSPLTNKPIENVIWPLQRAAPGKYSVLVSCANFNSSKRIPFKIEIQNKQKIKHYKGVMTPDKMSGITVCTFNFQTTSIYDNDKEKIIVPMIKL